MLQSYQPNSLQLSFLVSTFLLLFTFSAHAQSSGSIEGKVTDVENKPLPNINISLEGTNYGAASNVEGYYEINHIPSGDYTFVVSGIGYEKEKRSITIQAGSQLNINVTLSDSNQELQEVVVNAREVNKFNTQITEHVAKLPLENINNPQVYNTVTSELLEDQVVTNFEDVFHNTPGVFKLWESTGRGGDGAGYYSLRGFATQPQLTNGLPSLTNGTPDPANIDRVEIMKGPSGTLYGSSLISYGGLINVVTKKPYNNFGGEVSYKNGSFGLNRITADVNTPISSDEEIALRVNTAFHTENSFQDAGFGKSMFIAPSLSYQVNEDLSFLINTEYYNSESTNPTMLFLNRSAPLISTNIKELDYNPEHSFTSNNLTISNPTFNFQGQMRYQLSDEWTSQTAVSSSSAKTDGYYTYLWDFAGDGTNRTFARYLNKQNSTTLGTDIQQNFIGDFSIGSVKNKMVVGLDFFQQNVINNSSGYVGLGTVNLGTQPSGISKEAADTALATASVNLSETKQQAYSAYISDVVDILPQLSVMASLRIDHFNNEGTVSTDDDDYTQTAYSPKFGVVVKPVPGRLSVFANYMNGFQNVAPVTAGNQTFSFTPEHANQWETGIKANLLDDRVSATVSYYNITVSDVVRQVAPEEYLQDGENYSRGFEASITASPVPGLNIIAGYSHNESEVTKTDNENYLGRRPEEAGPKDLLNGWISYRVSDGSLNGLGFGFGGNYASENLILNREATGQFTLPSYTVLNGSVFYNTENYRLDLKINNLTDEVYYKGWSTINPQQPRNITASFTYKF
ncbi:TonB-dependent receptor [Aliifodinibius sp. S!AR15-10]|uniref:TonB-dependent receptor n=1 Tax=Aliifodinibius sp. S!AR15-10 TaxID=2950437 RepID=UPI002861171C|nr:TonB-dependent receptor [Aliifodinibius sp. S!AR15-10]MDR8391197.1 TonB-dependent receptor [Aliifodinibius sp. S!AR15-10]